MLAKRFTSILSRSNRSRRITITRRKALIYPNLLKNSRFYAQPDRKKKDSFDKKKKDDENIDSSNLKQNFSRSQFDKKRKDEAEIEKKQREEFSKLKQGWENNRAPSKREISPTEEKYAQSINVPGTRGYGKEERIRKEEGVPPEYTDGSELSMGRERVRETPKEKVENKRYNSLEMEEREKFDREKANFKERGSVNPPTKPDRDSLKREREFESDKDSQFSEDSLNRGVAFNPATVRDKTFKKDRENENIGLGQDNRKYINESLNHKGDVSPGTMGDKDYLKRDREKMTDEINKDSQFSKERTFEEISEAEAAEDGVDNSSATKNVTMVGTEINFRDAMRSLIELEYDALEAYKVAVSNLSNEKYKKKIGQFMEDHKKHVRDLSVVFEKQGEKAPKGVENKYFLTKGQIYMATLGGDQAILEAMLANEKETNVAYERMVNHNGIWDNSKDVLLTALNDEKRHSGWLNKVLSDNNDVEYEDQNID